MRRSTERILTTHGGRLPDPSMAGAFHEARASGDQDRAAGLLADGIREMVREQAERGIDVLATASSTSRSSSTRTTTAAAAALASERLWR
ncbi:MAG TPA: hypothetical protein VMI73_15645 [Trebonia sp.]|nr:hypothetical protein [Trebonia sp.]